MKKQYTPGERRALLDAVASGAERVECPSCGHTMLRQGVPPPAEVSYVRDRILLVCGGCHRATAIDRRAVERRRGERSESADS